MKWKKKLDLNMISEILSNNKQWNFIKKNYKETRLIKNN